MTAARNHYPPLEEGFRRLTLLGEGSFGKVFLGERLPSSQLPQSENTDNSNQKGQKQEESKETGREFCALKKLKPYPRKKYSSPTITEIEDYPEVVIMQKMNHPNVMALRGMVEVNKGFEMNYYMVMDFGVELLEVGRHKQVMLAHEQIRCLIQQLASAVVYLHAQGVMHRDIKPSNIYLMPDGTLKLADFSISTRIVPTAPLALPNSEEQRPERTGNVTTRHYRAPQIIYGSKQYDESVDIWSLGCTIAELLLGQTLFPGTTDIHQLELIFSVIGCPQDLWPQASELPFYLEFDNSKQPTGLKQLIPDADSQLIDFLENVLQLDPKKRPTAGELLKHKYLSHDTELARKELGKVCWYLHEKKLKELLKGKQ